MVGRVKGCERDRREKGFWMEERTKTHRKELVLMIKRAENAQEMV